MNNFPPEIRLYILQRDNYHCTQCNSTQYLEIHHIIANTKLNRKLYGDKIQSARNGVLCCRNCHNKHSLWDKEMKRKLKELWK